MQVRWIAPLACAFSVFVAAGCEAPAASATPLAPVSGTVTLNGQPLADATVAFGGVSRGVTGADGRYELSTGENKGSPVGKQRVYIEKWVLPDGSLYKGEVSPFEANARQLLPPRYSDEGVSELTADVPADGGTFDFSLKSQ